MKAVYSIIFLVALTQFGCSNISNREAVLNRRIDSLNQLLNEAKREPVPITAESDQEREAREAREVRETREAQETARRTTQDSELSQIYEDYTTCSVKIIGSDYGITEDLAPYYDIMVTNNDKRDVIALGLRYPKGTFGEAFRQHKIKIPSGSTQQFRIQFETQQEARRGPIKIETAIFSNGDDCTQR